MYNNEFIQEMKIKLLELKKDLLLSIEHEKEDFDDIIKNSFVEIIDQANNSFEQTFLEKLSSQELKKLELINLALTKIENGSYGICLESGQMIPETRLRAIPYALYTVEIQAQIDKGR